jgi:molecular chaperone GrpE
VTDRDTDEPTGPVVRDKRRIDPVTGQVRETAGTAAVSPADEAIAAEEQAAQLVETDLASLEAQLTERTSDVQRVHAEYANYRKRVERDRDLVREQSTAAVLAELLTVLDDIDRAKEHGEVVGGFKAVAESLEASVSKLGLEKFGEAGEPFDPVIHEALTHSVSSDVTETTCVQVFQPGYRFSGRLIRPARVAVADPEAPAPLA